MPSPRRSAPGLRLQIPTDLLSQSGRFGANTSGLDCRSLAAVNRCGNRRLNRAIHVIARTQAAWYPEAKTYMDKKRAEGKTRAEALRCLKRRLSDVVYRTLLEDHNLTIDHAVTTPAAA
jgi:hypothetical protein